MSAPLILPTGMLSALEEAYATPARAYHHFGHVQDVLQRYAEVSRGPGWTQASEVYLAVLYHDAVYDAGRRDNEARSAAMAMAQIGFWLPEAGIDTLRWPSYQLTARHGQFSPADSVRWLSLDARHSWTVTWPSWAPRRQTSTPTTRHCDEYRGHLRAPVPSTAAFLKGCWRASGST